MSAINAGAGGASSTSQTTILFGGIAGTGGHHEPGERENIASVVNGEDIWRGTASQIPHPDLVSGEQMTLVSTDTNDTNGGTGARRVEVHYLDSNGLEQSEIVVLNGTTGVNTSATNITFVNKIHTFEVGSNGVAAGDVTIYRTGDAARVYDIISAGGNMSLTSIFKVPSDKTLYISGWHASISGKDKRVTLRLRATTRDGDVFLTPNPVFLFIDTMNLEANALAQFFDPYVIIPATTIIKVSGWVDAPNAGAFISCEWQGYLVDL